MKRADEADQVRRLLAFLAPVMSLETQEDRLRAYREAWARLDPAAEKEEWGARYYANYTWDVCRYQPWFHEFLNDMERDVGEIGIEHVYFKGNNVQWFFGYGPKFFKARSVADPELRKLEEIFDTLYNMQKCK